jgi:hypothetical protein
MMADTARKPHEGEAVDAGGGPVIDPTANVLLLVDAAVKRQDDLRAAEGRRIDDLMALRAEHAIQLSTAEAKRIDAIRVVDVNAVAVASERATQQASVLATQVTASADALRALVAQTAQTMAAASEKFSSQLTERLSLIERAQYEGKGRQGVTDPQLAEMLVEIKRLREASQTSTGKSEGAGAMWGYVVGAVGLLGLVLSLVVTVMKFGGSS